LRVRLANTYGTQAITIGHATIGVPTGPGSADLVADSIHELTFNGGASITAFKGTEVISDPVAMDVPALSDLSVTIYLPAATGPTSFHNIAKQNSYVFTGDRADDPSGATVEFQRSAFYFLTAVDVTSRRADGAVVVLGDSISDGNGSTQNA